MKLALGTAQFGLDYGISNARGKIPKGEVFKILEYASSHGLNVLDTAPEYGKSEAVIGEYVQKRNQRFQIISKLPKCHSNEVLPQFEQSLQRLNSQKLYGYLIHHFDFFVQQPELWEHMQQLKEQGRVEKIGFSLYYPKEAEYLLQKGIQFDILQFPFSIFDQRFSELLPVLKAKGIEIHVRSVFMQGLVFKKPGELQGQFAKIKEKVSALNSIAKETGLSLPAICINFAALNQSIDKVVLGVGSLQNLQENIKALSHQNKVKDFYDKLLLLREEDESIILPLNWRKGGKK